MKNKLKTLDILNNTHAVMEQFIWKRYGLDEPIPNPATHPGRDHQTELKSRAIVFRKPQASPANKLRTGGSVLPKLFTKSSKFAKCCNARSNHRNFSPKT